MLTVYCKGNGGMSGTPAEPYRPVCQAACAAGHAASASSTFAHPHKTTAQDRLVLQRDRRMTVSVKRGTSAVRWSQVCRQHNSRLIKKGAARAVPRRSNYFNLVEWEGAPRY